MSGITFKLKNMSKNETCLHGGVAPVDLLTKLHRCQGGKGRHRCPNCAYEHGYIIGSSKKWLSYDSYCNSITDFESCNMGSLTLTHILISLGENQGGTGRHKCTNCAFKEGFITGLGIQAHNEGLDKSEPITKIDLELVSPPVIKPTINTENKFKPTIVDFVQREIRNRQLGFLGELFILNNEIAELIKAGKPELASQIIHTSDLEGDGAGYDILSFDIDGNEKKIEVKTTRSGIDRPFYVSRNELICSAQYPQNYFIYRLFDFDSTLKKAKYYILQGDMYDSLSLEAISYNALPKS